MLQELDESDYWLEILVLGGFTPETMLASLRGETQELIAIFVTVVVNTKKAERDSQEAFIPHISSLITRRNADGVRLLESPSALLQLKLNLVNEQ